jgi:hypothetical protein
MSTKARTNADNWAADITGVTAGTGITGGGTSGTVTVSADTSVVTLTGTQTLTNKTLSAPIFISPEERWTIAATSAPATVNFDAITQGALYYTTNSTTNWTLNVRGDSSTTLNSILAVGDTITIALLAANGATAYRHSALQIDGNSQTVLWSGGTAPAAGNASSTDAYSFTIIKTAATPTYVVLGAGPIKYA